VHIAIFEKNMKKMAKPQKANKLNLQYISNTSYAMKIALYLNAGTRNHRKTIAFNNRMDSFKLLMSNVLFKSSGGVLIANREQVLDNKLLSHFSPKHDSITIFLSHQMKMELSKILNFNRKKCRKNFG